MEVKDTITLPNAFLLKEVREAIEMGKRVTIPVKGSSMKPFLNPGDRVVLKPFQLRDLARGIIVLADLGDTIVLHRVVKYSEREIWLAGDANLVQHELISYSGVVAQVISFYPKGKALAVNSTKWRDIFGLFWYWARPMRRAFQKLRK